MTDKEKAQAHLNKILGMTDPEAIEGAIGEAVKDLGIGKPSAEHTADKPCTDEAPCFQCLRCGIKICNSLRDSPAVRDHMTIKAETEPTIHLTSAHVATLPTGERVELPAGTVLREAPTPIHLASAEEERAILSRATRVEVRGNGPGLPIVVLVEDDSGRTIKLLRLGAAEALDCFHEHDTERAANAAK